MHVVGADENRQLDYLAFAEMTLEVGVHGNGHLMMLERNNREALGPILAWLDSSGF